MQVDTVFENPRWDANGETITGTLHHPVFGPIPFTASPHDVEPHGRAIFEAAKDQAEPYEPSDNED